MEVGKHLRRTTSLIFHPKLSQLSFQIGNDIEHQDERKNSGQKIVADFMAPSLKDQFIRRLKLAQKVVQVLQKSLFLISTFWQ
jgi:hypothetical protein